MTASTAYVLSSTLWGLAGLVVGYIAGSVGAARRRLGQSDLENPMPVRATRIDNIIGVVVIIMAVVSVITTAMNVHAQSNQVKCQTEFNQAFIAVLEERNLAATEERAAQRKLLTTSNPNRDPEVGRRAITEYLDSLARADDRRDKNPLPAQPRC